MPKHAQPRNASRKRTLFRSPAAATAVAGMLATMTVFSPIATQQAHAAESVTETIDTTLSCQSFDTSNGRALTRGHVPPAQITVTYPREVKPGEQYTVKYQLSPGEIKEGSGAAGWAGRVFFDVTVPENGTINSTTVTGGGTMVSGFRYSTWTGVQHTAPRLFRFSSDAASDQPNANGPILRMMGSGDNAYPRNGTDSGYGIGIGHGGNRSPAFTTFQLPESSVTITAPSTEGDQLNFGLRNAGNNELATSDNSTQTNYANTFGFIENDRKAVTLCRPTNPDLAFFASTKVTNPYKPDFELDVKDTTAVNSTETITATFPDPEVRTNPIIKGTVTFKAVRKGTTDVLFEETATIGEDGKASVSKDFNNIGDYTVTATYNPPAADEMHLSTEKTAEIKVTGSETTTDLNLAQPNDIDAGQSQTFSATVTDGAVGEVKFYLGDATRPFATVAVGGANGNTATTPSQTFSSPGQRSVRAEFVADNSSQTQGTFSDASAGPVTFTVNDTGNVAAPTLTVANDTPVYAGIPSELKATLDDSTLEGTVKFFDVTDGTEVPLGTDEEQANGIAVIDGTATLANALVNASGPRQIKAVFTPTGGGTPIEGTSEITVIGPQDGGTLPDTGGAGIWANTAAALLLVLLGACAAVVTRRRAA